MPQQARCRGAHHADGAGEAGGEALERGGGQAVEVDGLMAGVQRGEEDEPGHEGADHHVEERLAGEALRREAVHHLRGGAGTKHQGAAGSQAGSNRLEMMRGGRQVHLLLGDVDLTHARSLHLGTSERTRKMKEAGHTAYTAVKEFHDQFRATHLWHVGTIGALSTQNSLHFPMLN